MNFETAAVEMFPELMTSTTITRRQVNDVVAKFKVKYPVHITNPNNNVSRGVFNFSAQMDTNIPAVPVVLETDEELEQRIRETYSNMTILVDSIAEGITNSLIISGAAGVGKSYGVRRSLESNSNIEYTYIRGYVKPTGIFKLLWENRMPNQILVFDDADECFFDVVGLNLLKSALEISKTRRICWMSEKEFFSNETEEQIPNYFDYQGQIIFLTNIDFHDLIVKGSKLSPHLAAIESRSIYLDLKIRSNKEKLIRIKQVVSESSILEDRGIYEDDEKELMTYLFNNIDRLREVSLRTVEKLAALYLTSPSRWKSLANSVMLK